MLPSIKMMVDNNINLKRYIRENSYLYKDILRNANSITKIEQDMLYNYKLRTSDKIENFGNKLELISTFLDVLK